MLMELDAIQITGIRPPSVQSTTEWGAFEGKDFSLEVEHMAQLCRTPSPDVIKRQLQRQRRPHSTPGMPLDAQRRDSKPPSRCLQFRRVNDLKKSKCEINFEKRLKKFKPPEATEVVLGPGYVLTTMKDRVIAQINTDKMFDAANYKGDKESKQDADERYKRIEQLQQEVCDLTVYLEEEKINHKIDVTRTSKECQKEIEKLKEDHANHISAIEEDNAEQVKELETRHKNMTEVTKNKYNQELDETKQELAFICAAFQSYKDTIGEELDTRWKQKELEVQLEFERKAEKLLLDQKNVLDLQKDMELDDVIKENKKQISAVVAENQREMDVLLRKFTASVADADRVKQLMHEAEEARKENKKLQTELTSTKEKLRKSVNMLDDTKIQLLGFQENFEEKVAEVDDKYASKVDNLMSDNTDLRMQYMKKCNQLYKVKSNMESQQEDGIIRARSVMRTLILSRTRADVSLVGVRGDELESGKMPEIQFSQNEDDQQRKESSHKPKRPLSAPSTPTETSIAVWQSRDSNSTLSPKPDPSQLCKTIGDNMSTQVSPSSKRQESVKPQSKLRMIKSAAHTDRITSPTNRLPKGKSLKLLPNR